MQVLVVLAMALAVVQVALVAPAEGVPRVKPRSLQRRRLLSAASGGHEARALRAAATDLSSLDCGGQLLSCTSCSTTLQCAKLAGTYRPLRQQDCPAATPYCSAGSCVASLADESCVAAPQPSAAFTCNGDGYYPDPGNCQSYWLCVGSSAYQYNCSGTASVFSYARAMCVPSTEAACRTVSCSSALVGVYQRYASAPEVYFVCRDAVAANALVAACPANYTVDAASGDCQLTCLSEGRLPDPDNSTRYYECTKAGTSTYSQPMLLLCPSGSSFSAEKERCLTGNEDKPVVEKGYTEYYYESGDNVNETDFNVPSTFKIGAASAAYQVEGAWNVSDKGLSIQDVFYHSRPGMTSGDVVNDAYHKYKDDVSALTQLQLDFYRFSISWPRVLPTGNSTQPSTSGTQYYNDVINALIAANIEPVITLYHWDLPQVYQDDGGWLNAAIQERFVDYATYCFAQFGDRVKRWILVNEPLSQCQLGYELGEFAPGVALPGTGAYLCGHNMVLAHAKAYRAYQAGYKDQGGEIGSAVNFNFAEPKTTSQADQDAAERWRQWQFAWFVDPLYSGDYPAAMRQRVDQLSAAENRTESRLPHFTTEEKAVLKGAMDFIGLNFYTGVEAAAVPDSEQLSAGFQNDAQVDLTFNPNWIFTSRSTFAVTPWSFANAVRWLKDRYNNMPVLVTENGYAGAENEGTSDQKRSGFYSGFMRGLMQAVNKYKCNVIGYTAWSLEDNLEWNDGLTLKFGLVYVDFNDPARPRTVKDSGTLFQQIITTRHVPYVAAT